MRISILAAPESSAGVLYGLKDVLSAAGTSWSVLTRGEPGKPIVDVRIVSATGEPFVCFYDVPVVPQVSVDEESTTDVALVCDRYIPLNESPRGRHRRDVAWLQRMHERGAVIASVCSGSLLLADTGLLDGQEATSHWMYRNMFHDYYPKVKLRPERVLCFAGSGHRIVTAGGQSAWQDLALYLVSRFCSREEAVRLAKIFMITTHLDGQLHFVPMVPLRRHEDMIIRNCQVWIADNYKVDHPVNRMVEMSGLAQRTFARRFHAATGYQPMAYVQAMRVEEAKQLLETTLKPVDEIGAEVGYRDPASFRRLFRHLSGLTPSEYRRKLGGVAGLSKQ